MASTSELQPTQIERVIKSIDQDLLVETYKKYAAQTKLLSAKVKNETSFYVTIFHKNNLILSRSISSNKDENNKKDPIKEEKHLEILQKFSGGGTVCSSKEQGSIFALQIGYTIFIVENHSLESAKVFAFLLAGNFLLLKSFNLIKEWGNWKQLSDFAKKDHPIVFKYLSDVQGIAFGKLGNHL